LQALMKRNQDLTPNEKEQTAITSLVSKIQAPATTTAFHIPAIFMFIFPPFFMFISPQFLC
jgi:hypothetical protein